MRQIVKTAIIVIALVFIQIIFISSPEQIQATSLTGTVSITTSTIYPDSVTAEVGSNVTIGRTSGTGAVTVKIGGTAGTGIYDNWGTTMVGYLPTQPTTTLQAASIINEQGATLKGYGRIIGAVTNMSGATFKVGGSQGTLEVRGPVTLLEGGSIEFTVAGSGTQPCLNDVTCSDGYSWLALKGAYELALGGHLAINWVDGDIPTSGPTPGAVYNFITRDPNWSVKGEFSDIIWMVNGQIVGHGGYFDPQTGTFSVPEPSTMLLLGFGLVGLTLISRKYKIG